MAGWGAAPLGHAPGTDDMRWSGRPRPADVDYLLSPIQVPRLQRITRLAMGATLLAAIAYAVFLFEPSHRGDWAPYLLLVGAELVLLANAAAMWLTSLGDDGDAWEVREVRELRVALETGAVRPSIDVVITAYGEPLDVLERTLRAARDMHLTHRTYLCDDGRSDAVRKLCHRLCVGYLRRHDRDGVKAGNVNRALERIDGDYVALFDADHAPHPDFLLITMPHMARPELAFVQLPQAYLTDTAGFVERGSAEGQQIFYEVICPGKNWFNAAFHVGTNALFRRTALDDVGGFFEDTHSEDIWTSIRLHQRGWSSIYLPHIVARGLSPSTVYAHFRQQFRWASGSFEILLRSNPLSAKGLTPGQRIQYTTPPLHFLTSFANVFYLLMPPLFLLFGVTPLSSDATTWLIAYLPYLFLTWSVLCLQTGGFRWRAIVLSVATVPVHVRAFFAVLFGRKAVWQATNSASSVPSVPEVMFPQLALVVLNVIAIVVGLSTIENPVATGISVGLCALHSLLLLMVAGQAAIDRRRAQKAMRASRRAEKKQRKRGTPAVLADPDPVTVAA